MDFRAKGLRRVISRKWYMTGPQYSGDQFAPGIAISRSYAELYPEWFGRDRLEGVWKFNAESGVNERIR
jgi:hypothetical protein